ncbi:hypothetical protein D3C87_2031370 [compost metagenome]
MAIPCPISSRLLLWRSPPMPSATTADSRDSMPPSMAIIKAGCHRLSILSRLKSGSFSAGRELGIAP